MLLIYLKDVICCLSTFFNSAPPNSLKTKHVKNGRFTSFFQAFSQFHRRRYSALLSSLLLFFVQWFKNEEKISPTILEEELFRLVLLWQKGKLSTFIPAVKFNKLFVMILGICLFSFLFSVTFALRIIDMRASQFTRFDRTSYTCWQEKTSNWSACFNGKIRTVSLSTASMPMEQHRTDFLLLSAAWMEYAQRYATRRA